MHRCIRARPPSLITRSRNQFFARPSTTSTLPPRRAAEASLPPLSLLPTDMLLRSLLVATVSSHERLLNSAFAVLTFLSKPRGALLSVERNPVLYWIVKKTLYDHFCAGENPHEVATTIRRLKDMGFKGVILTYAREVAVDASTKQKAAQETPVGNDPVSLAGHARADFDEDIETWRKGVLETVKMLGEFDYVALK